MNKYTTILLVLMSIYAVAGISHLIITRGVASNTFFWIAVAIEVGLGFISYKIRGLGKLKSWKRVVGLLLVIILAMGIPIGLYNTDINVLKEIGYTWFVYLLTINLIYIYQVYRKSRLEKNLGRQIEWDEMEMTIEASAKGLVWLAIVLIVLFGSIFGIVYGLVNCMSE